MKDVASSAPAVRARHMKNLMRKLGALESAARGAIEARIPEADRTLVNDSAALSWLPLGVDVRATEAIWAVLDAESRERFFRDLMLADFQTSLLRPLMTSAIKIFGMDPATFVRWTPKGFGLLFRHCGEVVVVEVAPGRAELAFDDSPPELSETWFESCRASLSAYLHIANASGDVTLRTLQAGRRHVMHFRWTIER